MAPMDQLSRGPARCALKCISNRLGMLTTLELPDPLFARLKAPACRERVLLKQLLLRLEGVGEAGC